MRERLKDKRQRWKAEQGHRQNRHWADRAIWSQPDHVTSEGEEDFWIISISKSTLDTYFGDVDAPALAYTVSDNKQWTRLGNEWVEVAKTWIHEEEHLPNFPRIAAPSFGYTSSDGKFWMRQRVGTSNIWQEIPMQRTNVTAAVHKTAAKPDNYNRVFFVGSGDSPPPNWQDGDVWIQPWEYSG